jgi:diacylglycerol O-acyltransferase / wax synthase
LDGEHQDRAAAGPSLPWIRTLQKSISVTAGLWKEATSLAKHPAEIARLGAGVAGELAWLLLMPEDSWTRFKGKPSGNKRVAWTDTIPLHEVKAVGKALGCTINDVLLASVAGALCQYLKDKGDPVRGIEIRALVPVDMRKSHEVGQLGNKFGIVGVELPVGIENPLTRLYEVHRRMQALKQSLEPPVTLGMFAVLGYAPQMLQDRLFNLLIHRATAVTLAAQRSSRSCSGCPNPAISGWVFLFCPTTAWCSSDSLPTPRWCPIRRPSPGISGCSSTNWFITF